MNEDAENREIMPVSTWDGNPESPTFAAPSFPAPSSAAPSSPAPGYPGSPAPAYSAPAYPTPAGYPAPAGYPETSNPVAYQNPPVYPGAPAHPGAVAPYANSGLATQAQQGPPRGLQMKARNPVGVWLGLPLITLGIYHLVWYYKIHREMAEFDRRRAISPAGPLLVLIFLGWTGIAPLISYYSTGTRIANAQRAAGMAATCSGGIGLLLMFVFGVGVLYYQGELNKIVNSYGPTTPAGTEIALRA